MNTLSSLNGTEKQVKWAEEIRNQFLANIEIINSKSPRFNLPTANKIRQMLVTDRGYEEYKLSPDEIERKDRNALLAHINKMHKDILDKIVSEKEATWFINNRFNTGWSQIPFYLPNKTKH